MVAAEPGADWLPEEPRFMDGATADSSSIVCAIEGEKSPGTVLPIDQEWGELLPAAPMQQQPCGQPIAGAE